MGSLVACFVLLGILGHSLALHSWELPVTGELWDHLDQSLDTNWVLYKKGYNKTYTDLREEVTRRLYWEDNMNYINDHNKKYEQGESTFYLGENDFTDMSEDEFERTFLRGLIVPEEEQYEERPEPLLQPDPEAPLQIDWRQKNVVTPVKNQGSCGSCWAFSALGSMESLVARKKGSKAQDFSEQNLLDCAYTRWGNYGCRGGWMNNAFKYLKSVGGVDSERCYPYRGSRQHCAFRKSCVAAKLSSYKTVGKSEYSLASDVSRVGPISIAADVSGRSFGSYRGGVWSNSRCNQRYPNHAMTAVGYGTASRGGNYWIIKNSWGSRWGNNGYIYMAKNNGNDCGIKSFASYPVV